MFGKVVPLWEGRAHALRDWACVEEGAHAGALGCKPSASDPEHSSPLCARFLTVCIMRNARWACRWTDASSRELVAQHYSWFLRAYDAYPSYIQRSDAARYFIIHHYGGVYADLDYECSKPFSDVIGR